MYQTVVRYINDQNMLKPGARVLVGVSGGADSMALLHILQQRCMDNGGVLWAAHLNHSLRSQAGQDEQLVRDTCRCWDIPCYTKTVDVAAVAARTKRSLKGGHYMSGLITRWIMNIAALVITAVLLPGFQLTVWGAIVGSVFLGIINAVIRPFIIVLTLPLNILTLGLFTFIINALMLWLTSATIRGFDIDGFGWAILSALLLSLISFIISMFIDDEGFRFR
jgi:putative membrane protein